MYDMMRSMEAESACNAVSLYPKFKGAVTDSGFNENQLSILSFSCILAEYVFFVPTKDVTVTKLVLDSTKK